MKPDKDMQGIIDRREAIACGGTKRIIVTHNVVYVIITNPGLVQLGDIIAEL